MPKSFLDLYAKCPKSLLEKVANLIENERVLIIGMFEKEKEISERITLPYKKIFAPNDEDERLFPELKHGMEVVLKGEVTRGNETSNSLGFRYQEHILTAYPETGSIVRYKHALFLKAQIIGTISRADDTGNFNAKRPKIIFTDIIPEEDRTEEAETKDLPLFKDDEE